ncbi:type II 3-dehydroquinate dehydratase [Polynucleobacter paneuropaeus]|jgi:3-dehydroquinate dehydratase-2|uniref:3-dehydroquinate dehydratase n=1 Tax=Polynucleobacter paneuropaeus TaxID=2527775 RepID=A0A9Q2WIZ6_9BURK|nr:type II 3-dehydroquinate dehydratase [Polynucleobacter paneuropaeus]AWW43952.1 type II 3-dehydroquinate dehydratase [Polynucleobacter paneuropaeus]AWW47369.1 type II 3-dehydroquinate dehydratase [Polynucleobacter paneuropaeus]MBT8515177.1 type II 3-dehydroquinate dehydratase [Polynucleobacter paneuropaeus]MBT8517228.1 type II 3-dehydroquinate dehydratase [Polynucleobacter paneuropaeus]MBT8518986.1 type II 3-dehydroquinate dehydratase [Polynucleobacter paneuropaeus]
MSKNPSILVVQGPNLNLLGTREPEVYGKTTLEDIHQKLGQLANSHSVNLDTYQSNHEGELIDRIQKAKQESVDFIIINPGAFTHTSVALRDVLAGVAIPFIEVHLSNIHQREEFRKHSYLSDIATGVICGLGALGYELAMTAAIARIQK